MEKLIVRISDAREFQETFCRRLSQLALNYEVVHSTQFYDVRHKKYLGIIYYYKDGYQ